MKKLLTVVLLLLAACAPPTMITGSWKSEQTTEITYDNMVVAALTTHAVAKALIEDDLATQLRLSGLRVAKSIDLFPQKMDNSDSDRTLLMQRIKEKNMDAILTVSIIKQEDQSRYIYGADPYDPFF